MVDAAAYAKSKGASLVKIESLEQNQWLQSYLTKVNTTANDGGGAVYSWLGGTDSVEERVGSGKTEPLCL